MVRRRHETIQYCLPTYNAACPARWVRMKWIFLNGQGIRAGWRALIFVGVYLALRVATQSALGSLTAISESEPNPPLHPLIRESCAALVVFFATWVMARIEKRNVFSYGYIDQRKLLRLGSGVAWGFFSLSLLICVLWQRGYLVFDGHSLSGMTAWNYGIAWGLMFMLVGYTEESLTRGYFQYTLTQGIGFWWSALLLSMVFVLLHAFLAGESALGLFGTGALGMVFCLSLWYTKSLFWAVGFHAGWDWGESYFYGTPDSGMLIQGHLFTTHAVGDPLWSGGVTGPEGSLFCLLLPILMTVGMWLWWGKNKSSATFPSMSEDADGPF
jgi:membrane protease YdiL (CAAX protease family)